MLFSAEGCLRVPNFRPDISELLKMTLCAEPRA
jgi:hypothetical protein